MTDRAESIQRIERVLNQGLVTADGKNLFAGRFTYLNTCGLSAAQVFDETLATLFNAAGGGQLYVENLKGATGEIALRVGRQRAVRRHQRRRRRQAGEAVRGRTGLPTGEREFSGSLFHEINKPHSTVNLLIGSKKFTEGWNSWRVSTMGLMNVGADRGLADHPALRPRRAPQGLWHEPQAQRQGPAARRTSTRPKHIGVLETLGIFGIHADYMAQFRDFLEEEGLPTNDDRDRVPAAGHQEPGHAEAQDDPPQEDDQRRQHRVRRRLPQARADPDPCQARPDDETRRRHIFRRTRSSSTGTRRSRR